jgi:hypothetical protein
MTIAEKPSGYFPDSFLGTAVASDEEIAYATMLSKGLI